MVTDKTHQPDQEVSGDEGLNWPGNMPRFFSGNPGRMRLRYLNCDVCSRIPYSNDQHSSFLQLRRIAVVMRMQLYDVRPQLPRKRGYAWNLIVGHRYNDIFRFKAFPARVYQKAAIFSPEPLYSDAVADREMKVSRVFHQVVCQLIFGRKRTATRRKGHSWKPRVPGGSKQS